MTRAAEYRREAERLRKQAEQIKDASARRQMIQIAEQYELLASGIDKPAR